MVLRFRYRRPLRGDRGAMRLGAETNPNREIRNCLPPRIEENQQNYLYQALIIFNFFKFSLILSKVIVAGFTQKTSFIIVMHKKLTPPKQVEQNPPKSRVINAVNFIRHRILNAIQNQLHACNRQQHAHSRFCISTKKSTKQNKKRRICN